MWIDKITCIIFIIDYILRIITAGIMEQINKEKTYHEDFTDEERDLIAAYRSMDQPSKAKFKKIIKK